MKKAYIGLDPGSKGYFVIITEDAQIFYPMPTHKVGTGKKLKSGKEKMKDEFHQAGMRDLVFKIKKDFSEHKFIAATEQVGGRGGWSATNNFNFGYVMGLQMMVLYMLRAEVTFVRPKKWQNYMRRGYSLIKVKSKSGKTMVDDAKAIAEMIVLKEWPEVDFRRTERSSKNDDNLIDAFLICNYLIRTSSK